MQRVKRESARRQSPNARRQSPYLYEIPDVNRAIFRATQDVCVFAVQATVYPVVGIGVANIPGHTSKFVELISPANMLLDTKVLYLTLKKAFFQDTKGHNSVINRCFDVHHPLILIYTHTKFQWNPPKHFQDMAPDRRTDGQRQNNIPPPMAGDKKGKKSNGMLK
ncbi:hypothetical protein DPMN_085890 [Dreissena polymorpha]|uniref:Uncharacterized protein n=1 Tax=Dreissena polymorpha TaxID=45954 RepID=A0A9D3YGX9_DREPO|nr:hypothetical protein DPMN_085890 [Dreissena polymorpha]